MFRRVLAECLKEKTFLLNYIVAQPCLQETTVLKVEDLNY
jgi:hypothetical protein